MTIRPIRIACWITKATNTPSKYVTFIALPLQQWLQERAFMLRHTYIACLVTSELCCFQIFPGVLFFFNISRYELTEKEILYGIIYLHLLTWNNILILRGYNIFTLIFIFFIKNSIIFFIILQIPLDWMCAAVTLFLQLYWTHVGFLSWNLKECYRKIFRNKQTFSRWGVVSPSPNHQAGGPPLVSCPRLLMQYIRSYPPYLRPFLHP
jgi:hypothetical protein